MGLGGEQQLILKYNQAPQLTQISPAQHLASEYLKTTIPATYILGNQGKRLSGRALSFLVLQRHLEIFFKLFLNKGEIKI